MLAAKISTGSVPDNFSARLLDRKKRDLLRFCTPKTILLERRDLASNTILANLRLQGTP